MNRIFKVVFNHVLGRHVVVSELASSIQHGKNKAVAVVAVAALSVFMGLPGVAGAAVDIGENPTQGATASYRETTDTAGRSAGHLEVGKNVSASGNNAIAIGIGTGASGASSVAIGEGAGASEVSGVAIGHSATSSEERGTAIGDGAQATKEDSSAYGSGSKATGEESTALGHNTTAQGRESLAGGNGAKALSGSDTALGHDSVADAGSGTAVGAGSNVTGEKGSAYGAGAVVSGKNGTAIGEQSEATKENASALGADASATGTSSTALGTGASASNAQATAAGAGASASGLDSTALGSGSIANAKRSVALGGGESTTDEETGETSNNAAEATAEDAVAIGSGSRSSGDSAVALGGGGENEGANASGAGAVAVGTGTHATGDNSVAIGGGDENKGATAAGAASIVLGNQASSGESAANGVAIGTGSSVTVENGVALGAGSVADVAAAEGPGYMPNPSKVTNPTAPTWKSTEAAVSVGNSDGSMTRQITGVAAGTNDWDAVNVAQLKNAQTHYYSVNDGGTEKNNYNNDGATGTDAIAAGVNASATAANASAFGSNVTANGENATAIGTAGTTAGAYSTAVGNSGVSANSYSAAMGYGGVSATGNSTAIGNNNISASGNSTAIGYGGVTATGQGSGSSYMGSLALGSNTVSASNGSTAIGGGSITASGTNSTAIGRNNVSATGSYATALGTNNTSAAGQNSTAIGSSAKIDSSSEGAHAFGKNVNVQSSSGGLALGNNTSLSGASGSTAVGSQTGVSGSNGSAALGTSSKVTGSSNGSTAVGNSVTVESGSNGSAAFGTSTKISSSSGSTAVGNNSSISGSSGVSLLGVNTTISGSNGAIAMGNYASISGSSGAILLAENNSSISNSSGSTAIGNSVSISSGSGSNVFGDSSSISSDGGSMVLGNSSNITSGSGSHLLGNQSSVNSSAGSTVIGNSSSVAGGSNGSHVFGNSASVREGSEGSVAIGNDSTVYGNSDGSYAIGGNAKVYGGSNGATAVGPNSEVSNGSGGSQAFGNAAKVINGSGGASAVGSGALVDGSGGSDAFGNNAKVTGGGGSTAVGNNAQVAGSGGATAVGTGAKVQSSDNGLAVGARSSVTGGWAGTAIGTDSETTVSQGVALGSNALADRGPAEENGYDPFGDSADGSPTWKSTAAAVSVGGKTFARTNEDGDYVDADGNVVPTAAEAEQIKYTRQITNVAAGLEDTDAVNVAQLKTLADKIKADGSLDFSADDYVAPEGETPAQNVINRAHGQRLSVIGDSTTTTDETGAEVTTANITTSVVASDPQTGTLDTIKVELSRDLDVDTVVVNGKDGKDGLTIKGADGAPGSIGMAGKDGEIKTITLNGKDGEDGSPGVDGESITRLIVDEHEVATLDDGLKFGANAPEEEQGANPVANKLNSTVNIKGVDAKEGHEYSAENLTTTVAQAEDGTTTITVKMDKDPNFDTLVVNGKDGKDGEPGTAGTIGIRGEPGEDGTPGEVTYISVTNDGTPGVDGQDGETRIIYKDPEGNDHEVATLDDGLKYQGDYGTASTKLNKTTNVIGDVDTEKVAETDLTTGNIGVVAAPVLDDEGNPTGDATLTVKLNKDINLGSEGSLVVGGTVNQEGDVINPITIANQTVTNQAGDEETGNYITNLDNRTWDPTNIVEGRAATEDQLAAAQTHYYSVNDDGEIQDNWDNKGATGVNALAAGTNAKATGDNSVAVGDGARVTTDGGVALGSSSVSTTGPSAGGFDIITGARDFKDSDNPAAWASTAGAVSVGDMSAETPVTRQITGVAAGSADTDAVNVAQLKRVANGVSIHDYSVKSVDPDSDLNYNNQGATGDNALAAGVNAVAMGENATAVGNMAIAREDNATAIGNKALASAGSAIAMGNDAQATKADAIAIGTGAQANHKGSVAIGSGAQTAEAVGTASYTIAGNTYNFAGTEPVGTVSVGTEGSERTITNVAAGRISETSTDAINGSQLYAVAKAISEAEGKQTTVSVGGVAAEEDGVPVEGGNLELERTTNEDGSYNYDVQLARDLDVDTVVINGKDGKDGLTIKGADGEAGSIGMQGEDGEIKTITITKDGKPGVDGQDGITRLIVDEHEVATLDDGMKYAGDFGDGAAVKLNNTVNVVGEAESQDDLTTGNIGVVAEQDGDDAKLTVKLNKDLNLVNEAGESGSITMGDVHIHDGDEISFGDNIIHNVAAGVEDTDVVNVSQLKEYTSGAKTEVTVGGGVKAGTDGNYNTGGNLDLNVSTAEDGHEVYDLKLSDNVELGGPGKDGADGVNGSIGVNGADGKSGVGIDGKDGITVYGKDGKDGTPAVAINGKDGVGHIGLTGPAGADGKDASADITVVQGPVGVDGTDGADGTDGMDRIEYVDHNNTTHIVATLDDGLKFGANDAAEGYQDNPVANKLNSTVNIVGEGEKEESSYSGKNLKTFVSQEDGDTTITVKMDRDLEDIDTIVVNGKDGKDGLTIKGADGEPGSIGMAGKDGEITHITVTNDGTPGVDGKDGITRIEYKDPEGNDHEVATLDDGVKYKGDKGDAAIKLNHTTEIVGGADPDQLSEGNIGVVAEQNGEDAKLTIKLAKDITDVDTIVVNGKDGKDGLTIKGADGAPGSIGMAGKDGEIKTITLNGKDGEDGSPGVDGESITRLIVDEHEVATLDDGIKYSGDVGNAAIKLNHTTEIVGGVKDIDKLSDNNIGVVAEQNGEDAKLTIKLAKDVTDVDTIQINNEVTVGGEGKDGKDGVDGKIGVKGADGKDAVTIEAKDGKDGHIGIAGPAGKDGKDGVTDIHTVWGDPTVGNDGDPGKDGITRIEYTDPEGNPHQVATMDDGLYFGANSGDPNPAANKLSSTVEIKGAGTKDDSSYDGKNLKTIISQEGEGADAVTTINVVMDKDLETDTVVINGKDGKDGLTIKGADGEAGSIGMAGKDGEITHITVTKDGTPGVDGKDGITRIEYKDPDGNDHEVATLDDGVKYKGDVGNAAIKLNQTTEIVGGAKGDLSEGNIGVVAEQNGKDAKLTVKLAKDIKDVNTVQVNNSVTVGTGGNTTTISNEGVRISKGPSITRTNIDMGGQQIHNVAPGTADTDAVNVSQLKEMGDTYNNKMNHLSGRIGEVAQDANAGVAMALAAASLPQVYLPGKSMMAIAGGTYRGEQGYAIGFSSTSDDGKWVIKAHASGNSQGHYGAAVGAGYMW